MICDFCSAPNPRICYDTAIIAAVLDGVPGGLAFDDRWSACCACAAIIDQNDKAALIERVQATDPTLKALADAWIADAEFMAFHRQSLDDLYTQFFAHLHEARRIPLEQAERDPHPPSRCDIEIDEKTGTFDIVNRRPL